MNSNPNYVIDQPLWKFNKLAKTTLVAHIYSNNGRIFLNTLLEDIIGFRVKSLTWASTPMALTNRQMLIVSCDNLIESTVNQSLVAIASIGDPSLQSQASSPRSIIATYVLQGTGQPIPNFNDPNFREGTIWFNQKRNINNLAFLLETELGYFTINSSHEFIITVEFFFELNKF